jgi:aldoxime dehydratase
MTMVFHVEYARTLPPRRPEGHAPAAPRYGMRWDRPVTAIVSDYFGIQAEALDVEDQAAFFAVARRGFAGPDGPDSTEIMRCTDEAGHTNAIVVAYWVDPIKHARWSLSSSLLAWFRDEARQEGAAGAWRETIVCPYDRHETIYSEADYRIGIGRTEGAVMTPITTNGYFGAARDRIPLAAIDALESPFGARMPKESRPDSAGRRLLVQVPANMVTLRSGQYWAHAEGEQLADYVDSMRPRLMTGMEHLLTHKAETGTLALRVMTNLNDDGSERRETSVYAHFLALSHLEDWSASHQTHLAIYRHAIAMNRKFKAQRQFVSWHELFVVPAATFEYVNCHAGTGLLPYLPAFEVIPSRH